MHADRMLIRLAVIGLLFVILFIVYALYGLPGRGEQDWEVFVAVYSVCVLAMMHLALLALAGFLRSRGSSSPLVRALALGGLRGTLWEVYRRRLAPRLRLPLLMLAWGVSLFGLVGILAWGRVLEETELRLVNAFGPHDRSQASPVVMILSLMTRDNNVATFYRSAGKVVRDLRRAGAKLVLTEQPSYAEPAVITASFPDPFLRESVMFYRPSLYAFGSSMPARNPHPGVWDARVILSDYSKAPEERPVLIGFRPVPSWYSQYLHAALAALSRSRGEPDLTRPEYIDGVIRYGSIGIPVDHDGVAWIEARPYWLPYARTICSTEQVEDSLLYGSESGEFSPFLPGSGVEEIRDRIVILSWYDGGGTVSRDQSMSAAPLAKIIDAVQRGRIVRRIEDWRIRASGMVLFLAALLALGRRGMVAVGTMFTIAAVLASTAVWLFHSQLVVAGLLYPVLTALLGGLVFPAVVYAHRNP